MRGRAVLIGDAAGYLTKCSGEGIYFAVKSGRMCRFPAAEGLPPSLTKPRGHRLSHSQDVRFKSGCVVGAQRLDDVLSPDAVV